MDQLWTVLAIALLPVAGSVAGALLVELWTIPKWVIGAALHVALGVAIGLVSVELMPRALEAVPVLVLAGTFAFGAAVSVMLSWLVRWWRGAMTAKGTEGAGKWQVYSATAVDLLSDGLMTGASAAVSSGLGLLLAVSQVVANFPGGFATAANFRHRGLPRKLRLLAAVSYIVPALVGAAGGFLLLRGAGDTVQSAVLGFIAGVLLLTTVEELVPEADRPGTRRWISTSGFVSGFIFILLLTSYFGRTP